MTAAARILRVGVVSVALAATCAIDVAAAAERGCTCRARNRNFELGRRHACRRRAGRDWPSASWCSTTRRGSSPRPRASAPMRVPHAAAKASGIIYAAFMQPCGKRASPLPAVAGRGEAPPLSGFRKTPARIIPPPGGPKSPMVSHKLSPVCDEFPVDANGWEHGIFETSQGRMGVSRGLRGDRRAGRDVGRERQSGRRFRAFVRRNRGAAVSLGGRGDGAGSAGGIEHRPAG